MKKFLTIFFVTLGVMFFCLIIVAIWFYVTDPLNLKPLLMSSTPANMTEEAGDTFQTDTTSEASVEDETHDRNPALNAEQEAALDTIGVDPASLPSSITPEQEVCFVEVLGQARVDEIKAGATPTALEFFQARGCL